MKTVNELKQRAMSKLLSDIEYDIEKAMRENRNCVLEVELTSYIQRELTEAGFIIEEGIYGTTGYTSPTGNYTYYNYKISWNKVSSAEEYDDNKLVGS
jgi:hypothetical protein